MRDLERKNALQWKNFKILQSEHNILKRNYLNLIEGHIDIVVGKNKTIKKLREQIRFAAKDYNKLLNREQNKGWNELD